MIRLATRGAGLVIAAALACSTPQKPPELQAFETLRADPRTTGAQKLAPDLMRRSDQLLAESRGDWEDNNLEEARHNALMGQAKLKHALALYDQAEAERRGKRALRDRQTADAEVGRLDKELVALNEQIALLEKLQLEAGERARLTTELQQQTQATSTKEQQLAVVQRINAAELAVKSAETVDAKKHSPGQYQAATDMLTRAQTELSGGQLDAAQVSADLARQKAERALAESRPLFEQEAASAERKAKSEALASDAASIPQVEVRREARGQLQRLVLHIGAGQLFRGKSTSITPGSDGVIEQVAGLIRKYPSYPVQVVGHTDKRGGADVLLARSLARAQSVFSALVSRGVEAQRMIVSGQGASEPIADSRSSAGRARNNRIEVVFLYQ
jgi:outer membrane protein OmpA-like peptidoglycan-associated protein